MNIRKWFSRHEPPMTLVDCQKRREVTLKGLGLLVMLPFIGLIQACSTKAPTGPGSNNQQDQTATGSPGSGANTDDLIVPRDCTLSQLLDRLYPGWRRWDIFPSLGDGILSVPRTAITSGNCTIWVNGQFLQGSGVNVDTIQLAQGDNLVIRPV